MNSTLFNRLLCSRLSIISTLSQSNPSRIFKYPQTTNEHYLDRSSPTESSCCDLSYTICPLRISYKFYTLKVRVAMTAHVFLHKILSRSLKCSIGLKGVYHLKIIQIIKSWLILANFEHKTKLYEVMTPKNIYAMKLEFLKIAIHHRPKVSLAIRRMSKSVSFQTLKLKIEKGRLLINQRSIL